MQTLTLIKLVQFSIEPWRQHLTTEQGGKKVTYAIFFKPTQHPQHSGWLLGNIEMKNTILLRRTLFLCLIGLYEK
jgi:hypothetical protein